MWRSNTRRKPRTEVELARAIARSARRARRVFGASGGEHRKGLVPDPGSVAGATLFLREDATWAAPPGGGGTPAGSVVTETTYGQPPAVGTSTDYARADHTHGTPAASAGSATTVEVDLGATPRFRGQFTITDASITATSKVLVWQAPGPYTGKGTRADEAELQPVQVIAVEPAAGSAVVRWQTPPSFGVDNPLADRGKVNASTQIAALSRVETLRRGGLVRGNVKFSYTVLA